MSVAERPLRAEPLPAPSTGVPAAERGRRRRAHRLVALGAVSAIVAGVLASGGSEVDDGGAAEGGPTVATTPVVRRTLVEREALDGTFGHAGASGVVNQRAGTVTGLAEKGGVVDRGQTLYEVDGVAVPLFFGERPGWRRLDEGVDDGPDVRQLEENLVALGHAEAGSLTVDDDFTSATTAAVERWEKSAGVDQDGVVELGEVVFAPGALRVVEGAITLGAPVAPGVEVLTATSSERVVTVDLDARRQGLVAEGDEVEVELPDGTRVPAMVASVGTVAETVASEDGSGIGEGGGDAEATVEVVVALSDPSAAGRLDQAPVEVHVERNRAEEVLAVPVNALLALAEGGYAVEIDNGGRRLVAVELGLFAEGMVQVSGEGLAEGVAVVVPA